MKLADKAVYRAVSESPGRNASEPIGGPDKNNLRGRVHCSGTKAAGRCRRLADETYSLWRGGRDSTVTRTCQATGEAVLVPGRNVWSKVGRITGGPGKSVEDETVAAGLVVALKRGNARGAKGPCCTQFLRQQVRQG
jgi:hypothetical protein